MTKYLTDTTAYISKLQENLQILSVFRFDFRFALIFPYVSVVIRDVRRRFPK